MRMRKCGDKSCQGHLQDQLLWQNEFHGWTMHFLVISKLVVCKQNYLCLFCIFANGLMLVIYQLNCLLLWKFYFLNMFIGEIIQTYIISTKIGHLKTWKLLRLPGFTNSVVVLASDSCSWLKAVEPDVVLCSCSSSTWSFDVLCILRCFSAHHG